MASSSFPRDGADGDLTLRPHAAAAPGGGGALAQPAKPFFGEALDLRTATPTTSSDSASIPPSPLLRAALENRASSSLGGSGASAPLTSYLTPQTAALAAELSALAVLGTGDAPQAPLEVAAARDGAPPEGAPLHLVVKKVSERDGKPIEILSRRKRARTLETRKKGFAEGGQREGMMFSSFPRREERRRC